MATERRVPELTLILLVAAVQFVNILDFVMVMPMGPDFASALGIPSSRLGLIGGSYTAAAAVSGLVCSLFLDKFDRRRALGVAMLGLVFGTAAGGFAQGLPSLMAARILAGAFGGPATSVAFSIIADMIPPHRRGRAMGIVMGAFSFASVLGVPAGLWLALQGGWRMPFFAVAGMGVLVVAGAVFMLPPLTIHLAAARKQTSTFLELCEKPLVLTSWATTAVVMMAGFMLIPNISAYVQFNLGYPRKELFLLYMFGGAASLVATQLGGFLVDRFSSFVVTLAGSTVLICTMEAGFVAVPPLLPVVGIFIVFMLAMGLRNVAYNTLATKVPAPYERARFMSIQSAVQHFSSAGGAFFSAKLLSESADRKLVGMGQLARISIALTILTPALIWMVEQAVRRRDREEAARPSSILAPGSPHDPGTGLSASETAAPTAETPL